MAAINGTIANLMLNATLPTGASAGAPGAWVNLNAGAMKLRINQGTSTAAAAGNEIAGGGYTAGGSIFTSSAVGAIAGTITLPAAAAGMSWTNSSGTSWTIASLDITDNAALRAWFGNFTGQPITVANGNTFQVAQNAITVTLS